MKSCGHGPNGLIARGVSQVIVDRLEVVHVAEGDGNRHPGFALARAEGCQPTKGLISVQQVGERVVRRLVLEFQPGENLLMDVAPRCHLLENRTRHRVDRAPGAQHPLPGNRPHAIRAPGRV